MGILLVAIIICCDVIVRRYCCVVLYCTISEKRLMAFVHVMVVMVEMTINRPIMMGVKGAKEIPVLLRVI